VALDDAHRPTEAAKPFIASTMDEIVPKFSPDGKQLVFVSKRSGSEEVWISRSDGTNPVQLTSMGYTGSPSWSPDGSHIVFDSVKEGQYEVYSMLATGGAPRRLTNHPSNDGVACYSVDGRHIYFMSNRDGSSQVWRMVTDGSELTQITKQGGYLPRPSADGKFLYYSKKKTLWRVPVNGGEEVQLPVSSISSYLNFTVTADAIYYIPDPSSGDEVWIERFDLATQATRKVVSLSGGVGSSFRFSPDTHVMLPRAGLSVSPDGRTLVWAQSDQAGSDIMLTKVRSGKD
jgi:dipeptidyl aminopeptidase/acylaminoacyl peptidase